MSAIVIHRNYHYEREACDCCDGWWVESWTATVDDEQIDGVFSERAEVESAIFQKLFPEATYILEEPPSYD